MTIRDQASKNDLPILLTFAIFTFPVQDIIISNMLALFDQKYSVVPLCFLLDIDLEWIPSVI